MLAPNADMMTLDGTNTWVLREPEPGGRSWSTRARRSRRTSPRSRSTAGEVGVVLLTHHHADHSEAAREFAERVGCGVRALDPAYRLGSEGLGDGDVVAVDGLEVHVVATPGHTADSLSFVVPAERAVLTGDTVLGRGTTVVAHPDGQLGAYLDSLDRLHRSPRRTRSRHLAGPRPGDRRRPRRAGLLRRAPRGAAGAGRGRRRAARRTTESPAGDDLPRRVVEIVYADVDPVLWGAAELSVRAQLAYLGGRQRHEPAEAVEQAGDHRGHAQADRDRGFRSSDHGQSGSGRSTAGRSAVTRSMATVRVGATPPSTVPTTRDRSSSTENSRSSAPSAVGSVVAISSSSPTQPSGWTLQAASVGRPDVGPSDGRRRRPGGRAGHGRPGTGPPRDPGRPLVPDGP